MDYRGHAHAWHDLYPAAYGRQPSRRIDGAAQGSARRRHEALLGRVRGSRRCRFAAVTDPQGAAFNLFKPSQSGQRAVSRDPGQVGWHELHTTDWAKAFEFYADMFGWLKGDAMDMGPMGTYQLFSINGTPSGAMFNSPAAQGARFWLYYFNVGNIDEAVKRLSGGGGKVMNGPVEVPGGGWIVQAADPQGAAFALLGSRK
jgi:predicted enzyme related to lactoylglutathione lyase